MIVSIFTPERFRCLALVQLVKLECIRKLEFHDFFSIGAKPRSIQSPPKIFLSFNMGPEHSELDKLLVTRDGLRRSLLEASELPMVVGLEMLGELLATAPTCQASQSTWVSQVAVLGYPFVRCQLRGFAALGQVCVQAVEMSTGSTDAHPL